VPFGSARNSDARRQIVAGKGVNAQKPDRSDGVHRNSYPHAVHGGKLHGYVEVLNPERGSLKWDSNDLPDAVRRGIHPDVAKQQSLFLAFGNNVQHVLRDHTKVLLAQEDEVIIGSADVSLVTFFGRNNFLLQNGAYDLFTSRVTLRIGDCECFDVRWSKADLGRYIRDRLRIVGLEYFLFPGHFVGTRQRWVLLFASFQRIQDQVQIGRGNFVFLCV
jgi:hypothetical protein